MSCRVPACSWASAAAARAALSGGREFSDACGDRRAAARERAGAAAANVVLLDPGEPDGYLRQWQPPGFPPMRHVAYAVQWFGSGAALAVIYVVTNVRRARRRAQAARETRSRPRPAGPPAARVHRAWRSCSSRRSALAFILYYGVGWQSGRARESRRADRSARAAARARHCRGSTARWSSGAGGGARCRPGRLPQRQVDAAVLGAGRLPGALPHGSVQHAPGARRARRGPRARAARIPRRGRVLRSRVAAHAAAGSHHGAGERRGRAAPRDRCEHAGASTAPAAADRVYLIDPLGNLMMCYAAGCAAQGHARGPQEAAAACRTSAEGGAAMTRRATPALVQAPGARRRAAGRLRGGARRVGASHRRRSRLPRLARLLRTCVSADHAIISREAVHEMVHRYFASTLGAIIVALLVWAWLNRRGSRPAAAGPVALLFLLVCVQGALGMKTVTCCCSP